MGEPIKYPKINRLYKHYKGGTYRVLFIAKHSENNETLVIYQSIEHGSFHARPLSMWFDNANKTPEDDGKVIYRFVLIDEKERD